MHSNGEAKQEENFQIKKGKSWVDSLSIGLRVSSFVASITAACIGFTSSQSSIVFGIQMEAKYSFSSAFKFFAYATAIASVSSALSLGFTFFLRRRSTVSSKANHHWFFFMHDLVMMLLVLSGSVAATSIGYVGKYGNDHAGWMPICDHFHIFCRKVAAAVVLGYFSFLSSFLLTIISAIEYRSS
ncbi:CASP-like protein 1F1 [Amaranthus tricolor]|uniref:CASP-like protein 1F1 n=1 Tax=Amaranthus tricolor TaxID=29722 RepID=UPI002590FC96|nr:CASP-like protein 1F1 [Amaranthus tricolor]